MKHLLFASALFLSGCATQATQSPAPSPSAPVKVTNPCEAYTGRPAPQGFAGFDADQDGKVTRSEFLCQETTRFGELDRDHNGFLSTKELRAAKLFRTKDQNQDGRQSIIEYMWAAEQAAKNADHDKDGKLSAEEYTKGFR